MQRRGIYEEMFPQSMTAVLGRGHRSCVLLQQETRDAWTLALERRGPRRKPVEGQPRAFPEGWQEPSNKKLEGKAGCLLVPAGVKNDYMHSTQGSQNTFSRKGQRVNILGFRSCRLCVTTTQLTGYSVKAAINEPETNGSGCVPLKRHQHKQVAAPDAAHLHILPSLPSAMPTRFNQYCFSWEPSSLLTSLSLLLP